MKIFGAACYGVWSIVLVLVWFAFQFVHLYYFSYPSMDSWCYFAPAAFSHTPFQLSTPLLGNFEGAATQWGLNWPGGALFLSLFTSWLPKSSALYVVVMLIEWLLLSILICIWISRFTHNSKLLFLAFACCLFHRHFFGIAWFERHEFLGCIALVSILLTLYAFPKRSITPKLLAGVLFFTLPLLQPATLITGGVLLGGLILQALCDRKNSNWSCLAVACSAYIVGLGAFSAYYGLHSDAWSMFRDHAAENVKMTMENGRFFLGRTFLESLTKADAIGNSVFFLAALILSVLWLPGVLAKLWSRKETLDQSPLALTILLFLTTLATTQGTYNGYYMIMASPFAIALVFAGLAHLDKSPKFMWRQVALIGAILLLLAQLAVPVAKTRIMIKAGYPRFRPELLSLASSLPPARHIFIPAVLWEAALQQPDRFTLNALPYHAGIERKERYAAYVQSQIQSGDLLLTDRLADEPCLFPVDETNWEKIDSYKNLYFSSTERGYDIIVWRRK